MLSRAAECDHEASTLLLIDSGAGLEEKEEDGQGPTPLLWGSQARSYNHPESYRTNTNQRTSVPETRGGSKHRCFLGPLKAWRTSSRTSSGVFHSYVPEVFGRMIADEAHSWKSTKTQAWKSAQGLNADISEE